MNLNDPVYVMGFIAGFAFCAVVVSLAYLFAGHFATKVARKVAQYDESAGAPTPEEDAAKARRRAGAKEARSGYGVQSRDVYDMGDAIADDNDASIARARDNSASWPK